MSISKRIFPYYQGESTIFDKGNFHYHTPDSNNLLNFRADAKSTPPYSSDLICCTFSLHLVPSVPCTYCRPSGKPSELQACMHMFVLKKEKKVQQIKRERSIKGEGGLYKKTKNSYSLYKVAKDWRNIPFRCFFNKMRLKPHNMFFSYKEKFINKVMQRGGGG